MNALHLMTLICGLPVVCITYSLALCDYLHQNKTLCLYLKNIFLSCITFTHLADAFIQSDLQCIQAIYFVSMCVPWELNPQLFALLMQCSTTEPQEYIG